MNIIIVVVEVFRVFLMNWDKLLFEKLIIIVWEFCRFINKIGDKIDLFFFYLIEYYICGIFFYFCDKVS